MWLEGISLKGHRSYSNDEGVDLTQFRKMNFFIGPNNNPVAGQEHCSNAEG